MLDIFSTKYFNICENISLIPTCLSLVIKDFGPEGLVSQYKWLYLLFLLVSDLAAMTTLCLPSQISEILAANVTPYLTSPTNANMAPRVDFFKENFYFRIKIDHQQPQDYLIPNKKEHFYQELQK